MSNFKRYPKIHRLGKEETEGILNGLVHVEEKIDGANASIWVEDGKICVGSRNNKLTSDVLNRSEGDNGFNGLLDYVAGHEGIKSFLLDNPEMRLYGEWLVRHTIHYKETAYKQFYLFDVTKIKDGNDAEEFIGRELVHEIADSNGINRPTYHGFFTNPNLEDIVGFIGKSSLGEEGEGIVLKNEDFRDAFGNHCHAKIVSDKFKENNAVTFGGNDKHNESYNEVYVVNKYMTLGRVEKIMHNIQPEISEKLDLKHIPRISNTAYYDMLTEEIWEITGKVQELNFIRLKRIATAKAIQIYKDILIGILVWADQK